jgi:hypothetical protein
MITGCTQIEINARLWSKVEIPDTPHFGNLCWNFQRNKAKGYGQIFFNNKAYGAHRVALWLATGVAGTQACHHCDNPACCNPRHLYWGDAKSNAADARRRNRRPRKMVLPPPPKPPKPPKAAKRGKPVDWRIRVGLRGPGNRLLPKDIAIHNADNVPSITKGGPS